MTKYIAVIGTPREYDHWVREMREQHADVIYKSTTRYLTRGETNYFFLSSSRGGYHIADNIRGMILDDVIYLYGSKDLDIYAYCAIESRLKRSRV